MFEKHSSPPSRRLFVLFVATTLAPAMGLAWLGWRLVEQDRALENQRIQERRDHAADLGAAALQRVLTEVEEKLATISAAPPGAFPEIASKMGQGIAIAVFGPQGVLHHAGGPLPYYPAVPPSAEPSPAQFAQAEAREFRDPGPHAAIPVLKRLVQEKDRAVQAGALLRLARSYRKAGDFARALAILRKLGELGDTPVDGVPAGLLAHQGAALILEA